MANHQISFEQAVVPFATAAAIAIVKAMHAWQHRSRDLQVTPVLSATEIGERLSRYDFSQAAPLVEMAGDVAGLLEHGTLLNVHPRYFGLFNPGVVGSGVLADALAAFYNPQLGAMWHAPAASAMERRALSYFAQRFGIGDGSPPSCFTSGGSESNLSGVLAALAWKWPRMAETGIGGLRERPVFYASDQAHDSFVKIARIVGLGSEALRRVRSDARQRMDISDLRRQIAVDHARGNAPFLIVATIGTTATAAIDPIEEIAAVCREYGLWLHTDAAWGGIAALTSTHAAHVAGLTLADSLTCDAHKILPIPMGAGMFFCRDGTSVRRVFDVQPGYVPHGEEAGIAAYQHSLQWSRRAIGLKVFMTLAELGADGVKRMIDAQFDAAQALKHALLSDGWQVTNDSPLPLVCFIPPGANSRQVEAIAAAVVAEGSAWLSTVKLDGGVCWLRACITNHGVTADDIAALIGTLDRARRT